MLELNEGIIAELDRYLLRKNPSDFLNAKDETGEIAPHRRKQDCGSLRPGLIAVRHYVSRWTTRIPAVNRKSGLVGLRVNLNQPEFLARAGFAMRICQPKHSVKQETTMSVASLYQNTCVICEDISLAAGKLFKGTSTFLSMVNTSIEAAQLARAEKHIEAFELMKRID
jgi:hypothetical protein